MMSAILVILIDLVLLELSTKQHRLLVAARVVLGSVFVDRVTQARDDGVVEYGAGGNVAG